MYGDACKTRALCRLDGAAGVGVVSGVGLLSVAGWRGERCKVIHARAVLLWHTYLSSV